MKILKLAIPIALCVIFLIVPLFELVGLLNGLDFNLYNEMVIGIVQTVLAVAALVGLLILKPEYGWTGIIFLMLALPISLLNAMCFVGGSWVGSIFLAIIWCGCILTLYIRFVPDNAFKAMSAVLSVLITVAIVVIYLWGLVSGFMGSDTVEETIPSPNGKYVLEITTEESLLSSKMAVKVRLASPVSGALLGDYSADAVTVYEGEPHEADTAKIEWKNESTIVIDGNEYVVSFK